MKLLNKSIAILTLAIGLLALSVPSHAQNIVIGGQTYNDSDLAQNNGCPASTYRVSDANAPGAFLFATYNVNGSSSNDYCAPHRGFYKNESPAFLGCREGSATYLTICSVPPGYYTTVPNVGGKRILQNGVGTFINVAQASAGYYASSGRDAQFQCNSGTYSPSPGATTCTLASPGHFVPRSGATSQTPARIGYYVEYSGSTAENICRSNTTTATTGTTDRIDGCLALPGFYRDRDYNIRTCYPGTFKATLGNQDCTLARAGYYVSSSQQTAETICPANSTSNAGASACYASPGYYTNNGVITQASAGYYAPGNTTSQTACPTNSTSNAGSATCSSLAGYYATLNTQTGAITVTQASAGFYAAAGATSQTACAAGSFSSAGASSCTTASAGYYAYGTGVNGSGATAQTACPANSTSNAGASACSANPGYYRNNGVITQASAGYYAPGNTTSQTACPANSTSNAGASTCTSNAGYYVTGLTNVNTGASSLTVQQASSGFYAAAGATSQTACAAGSFSSAGASSCTTASAGYYAYGAGPNGSGATVQRACQEGSTSNAGASNCYTMPGFYLRNGVITPASPGYYVSTSGATEQSACPAGRYSGTGASSCTPASPNYYVATAGSSVQVACPAGTGVSEGGSTCFFNGVASNSLAYGGSCPAGSFINSYSTQSTQCGLCRAGTFSATVMNIDTTQSSPRACGTCPAPGVTNLVIGSTACSSIPSTAIPTANTSATATATATATAPNIARGKPATQSSEDSGGAAGRAVDGNADGYYASNSVTHTSNYQKEYWMVDLQANYAISGIKITNRFDSCCSSRIVGATVQVLDQSGAVKWSEVITVNQGVYQFSVPSVTGYYVRVLNKPYQYLSLAEVEVFGIAR